MLTHRLPYPLQHGDTSLHLAAMEGHTACVERLLSTPGIDVNIKDKVSCFIECRCMNNTANTNKFPL